MSSTTPDDDAVAAIDAAMRSWQQGDVIRPGTFSYLVDTNRPGTTPSQELANRGGPLGPRMVTTSAAGLVVISQTCDIVAKTAREAPFVDVAVLVELAEATAAEARNGDRPRYAWLPGLGDFWFTDLDQVMTVEKAALAGRQAERGVRTDREQDAFGAAIARKFGRFAFPDDVHLTLADVQARWKSRHRRAASPEGGALQRVRQIRVEADPSWQVAQFDVNLVFVLGAGDLPVFEEPVDPSTDLVAWAASAAPGPPELAARLREAVEPEDVVWLWDRLAEAWAAACAPRGAVNQVTAEVVCADEYTIDRYWRSHRLDLDYLSGSPAHE